MKLYYTCERKEGRQIDCFKSLMCSIFLVREINLRPTSRLGLLLLLTTVLQVAGTGKRVLFVTEYLHYTHTSHAINLGPAVNLTFPKTARCTPC
jgi:hypothetical protein